MLHLDPKKRKYLNLSLFYYQIAQIYPRTNWLSMRKGLVNLSTKTRENADHYLSRRTE